MLGHLQNRGESREVAALRFELRKHGILKGYTDSDKELIKDNADYFMQEWALVWAIVKAENGREQAMGGVLSPIRGSIMRREKPQEWSHLALSRGLFHYQIRFVRRHPNWWANHCKGNFKGTTGEIWRSFFWDYRTHFIKELSVAWIGEVGEHTDWRNNVLTFWASERR